MPLTCQGAPFQPPQGRAYTPSRSNRAGERGKCNPFLSDQTQFFSVIRHFFGKLTRDPDRIPILLLRNLKGRAMSQLRRPFTRLLWLLSAAVAVWLASFS